MQNNLAPMLYVAIVLLSLTGCGASAKHAQPEAVDVRVARPRHVRGPTEIDVSVSVETTSEPTNAQQQYEQAKQGAQREDKDAAKAAWEQAQAAERIARKRLSDATLLAPIGGFIAKRNIEPGAMASPSTSVFTIVKLDPVEIQVGIPETDIRLVHRGQKAIVTATALPGMSFSGQVHLVNVSAEPQTRTYMTRITVPNREGRLLVGMIAEARIVGDGQIDVLTLPGTSIVRDPQ